MRERDKATKLKANIVSAQGLITLSEDIAESNSTNGQRAKRRSAHSLSLHERLQSLVADDKASEPVSKIEWDNRSTSSSTTDDSEFRALYSRMATNNRTKKTAKDRSTQITKERPLRVAMGPQGECTVDCFVRTCMQFSRLLTTFCLSRAQTVYAIPCSLRAYGNTRISSSVLCWSTI